MINLLPSKQKEELSNQLLLRLILILAIVFLSSLLSLFLILFLIKSYISFDLEAEQIIFEEEKRIIALNQDLEKEIIETNNILLSLNSFYKKGWDLTEVLEKINEKLPPGSYLTNLNVSTFLQKGEEKTKISLEGYCTTREKLSELKERFEEEEIFTEVDFPPENWVKQTDVDFKVSFGLKQR